MRIPRYSSLGLGIVALFAFMLVTSCDTAFLDSTVPGPEPQTVLVNGYDVVFQGTEAVGATHTKFSWKVSGISDGPPSLDWFFVENACHPDASTSVEPSPNRTRKINGIDGYQWTASLPASQSRTYSLTFSNDHVTGVGPIAVIIRRGNVSEQAQILGPCGVPLETVELSGRVSVGALGIGGASVSISGSFGFSDSETTAENGTYSFDVPKGGTYTIAIRKTGGLNSILLNSYVLTGGDDAVLTADGEAEIAGIHATVDKGGLDFVFEADTDALIANLSEGGEFQSQARSAQWWRMAIHHTMANRCWGDADERICRGDMIPILQQIFRQPTDEEDDFFLLGYPFDADAGVNALFTAANAIMWPQFPDTDEEEIFRNLFAMQLNYFKGWGTGPVGNAFDLALFSFLEQWVQDNPPNANMGDNPAQRLTNTANNPIIMFGGGGGGEVVQVTRAYLGGGGGGEIVD